MGSADDEVISQIQIQCKYEGYINKQREQVRRFEKLENRQIPKDIDYEQVYSLSNEALQKLKEIRPISIGHASRISGVTPADINILLISMEKKKDLAISYGNKCKRILAVIDGRE